jgi:hypothetical protein
MSFTCYILGAFTKLWTATVSFVLSVCPCPASLPDWLLVCPHGTAWLPLDNFHEIRIFEDFSKKFIEKIQVLTRTWGTWHEDVCKFITITEWIIYIIRSTVFQTVSQRKSKHTFYTGLFIMFSVITNIYNKKTKRHTLMELFTATGKLKKVFFLTTRDVRCVHHR